MKKLESINKVTVKGKEFGGPSVLACIPMIPTTREGLIADTTAIAAMNPDIIEWRIDYFEEAGDPAASADALKAISPLVENIPIIFTLRHKAEGGARELTQEQRLATIKACLETDLVDIIDVELACNEPEFIQEVRQCCTEHGARLILSCHDFKQTPSIDEMVSILEQEQAAGADIPKLAVMPQTFEDVMKLMTATYRARTGNVTQPMITMSMSDQGKISRVIGDLYGSDMSFVVGTEASAPGQIPVHTIRQLWDLLA
ncbi:MAG: type I 3-dehydroquinate dehydratase [Clostridiales bacterium]|nr:type I 3-dehydroquinate dehydratase [Clostridiales bacterium]